MMVKTLKIIGISSIAIILLLVGIGYHIVSNMCANTVITSSASPNGKWKIILFERNCGATTGFSSQISLLESDAELNNEAGNIYAADSYPESYRLSWESNNTVKIICGVSKSNRKLTQFNGIQFIYE